MAIECVDRWRLEHPWSCELRREMAVRGMICSGRIALVVALVWLCMIPINHLNVAVFESLEQIAGTNRTCHTHILQSRSPCQGKGF